VTFILFYSNSLIKTLEIVFSEERLGGITGEKGGRKKKKKGDFPLFRRSLLCSGRKEG